MNYYLLGYEDCFAGNYVSAYSKIKEYNRGWDDAVKGIML